MPPVYVQVASQQMVNLDKLDFLFWDFSENRGTGMSILFFLSFFLPSFLPFFLSLSLFPSSLLLSLIYLYLCLSLIGKTHFAFE
jgi:hypothetical protein